MAGGYHGAQGIKKAMKIVFERDSTKKGKSRYLKRVIALCLVMNIIITFSALVICCKTQTIDGTILAAIIAPWCVEFALGAWVKTTETKKRKDDNDEA